MEFLKKSLSFGIILSLVIGTRPSFVFSETTKTAGLGLRDRTLQEIAELEQHERREEDLYEQEKLKVKAASDSLVAMREHYEKACATAGQSSPDALEALKNSESIQKSLLAQISQRDHTIYQMRIIEKGIADRRFLLQTREAKRR